MTRLPIGLGYGLRGRAPSNPYEQTALANAMANRQSGQSEAMAAAPVAFSDVRTVQGGGQISPSNPLARLATKTADGKYYMASPPSQPAGGWDRGASFERMTGQKSRGLEWKQASAMTVDPRTGDYRKYSDLVGDRRASEAKRISDRRAAFVEQMGFDPVLDRAKAKRAMGNERYTGLAPALGYTMMGGGAPGGLANAIPLMALGGNQAATELSRQQTILNSEAMQNASREGIANADREFARQAQRDKIRADILADPNLTDAQKRQVMSQLENGLGANSVAPVQPQTSVLNDTGALPEQTALSIEQLLSQYPDGIPSDVLQQSGIRPEDLTSYLSQMQDPAPWYRRLGESDFVRGLMGGMGMSGAYMGQGINTLLPPGAAERSSRAEYARRRSGLEKSLGGRSQSGGVRYGERLMP